MNPNTWAIFVTLISTTVSAFAQSDTKDRNAAIDADPFKMSVRPTQPLTPEEERSTFVLPAGFEAQLVAAEPEIAKPMNIAFDWRGRLWVSSSVEYPYPAPPDREGRDRISILEDTNGDGRADKITTFADKLNIPIGLYPYGDGVICYSIPNIWYLRDTDGDDKADKREVLYGPFDYTRDTHGMCNALTRDYDGWLYACHGFNNQSSVAGKDGNRVTMQSGNTFRIRLDGSRIEQFTHGQVNPFGMALDPFGDLFTADCHTKPITMLIKGGFFQSFGKPHDGLGFVPAVMEHLHGSTAIAGIALYHADQFPHVYHGNAFGGNVMTSRVNRNSIRRIGSSVRAQEKPDFLISGDPWFRPVDLQVGPDGALYIADFYNRIIGHYEVPLDHPGRDRQRGRIWRIVYKPRDQRRDADARAVAMPAGKLDGSIQAAIANLASENLTTRMLATDFLVDQCGPDAIGPLHESVAAAQDSNTRIHARWALQRLGKFDEEDLLESLRDQEARARSHAFQMVAAMRMNSVTASKWIKWGFEDPDPHVRRSAVMASMAHRSQDLIAPLLELLDDTAATDHHLRHAIRMSLRDHLGHHDWFAAATAGIDERTAKRIIDLCLAVKTEFAGEFVASHVHLLGGFERERLSEYLTFAARYASLDHLPTIANMAADRFAADRQLQEQLLRAIRVGLQQRGSELPPVIRDWASRLARQYLGISDEDQRVPDADPPIGWTYIPHPSAPDRGDPWTTSTKRNSADGQRSSMLHSSFPKGESMAGIYRSDVFVLPAEFSFYLAGHDGFPDQPLGRKNLVHVRDAATKVALRTWSPPRNDTARPVTWDTGGSAGRDVYVELIDGDTAGAYAWLAVGRFSVQGLNPTEAMEDRRRAALLISDFRLENLRPVVAQLISNPTSGRQSLTEFAKAYAALQPSSQSSAIAESFSIKGLSTVLREELKGLLLNHNSGNTEESLGKAMKVATAVEQRRVANHLSSDQSGLEILVSLIEAGRASPRLLMDAATLARVASIANSEQKTRIQGLVKDQPNEDLELIKVVQQRKSSYLANGGKPSTGAEVFRTQCGVCHQVAGRGVAVGPNLDGIGNRGLDRVIEDVLIPNRNIDAAFRASVVLTDDGYVISGLIQRIEGAQLVIIDQQGKQITIPSESIDERKTIASSPMPANFHESLSEQQTHDLLAYLLSLIH